MVDPPAPGQRIPLQLLPTRQNRLPPSVEHIIRRHIAKRFVIPLFIAEGDEPADLLLQFRRRFPREQVHLLLARAMMPLDLAVGLRVKRRGEDMSDPFGCR